MNEPTKEAFVSIDSETPEQFDADLHNSERREQIRKEIIAERSELPKPYRLHKSSVICDQLTEALKLTAAMLGKEPADCHVAVYSAFEDEVQLDQFIRTAYDLGAQVAFPCMVSDAQGIDGACQQTMEMRQVSKEDYLAHAVSFLNAPLKKFTHENLELENYPYVPANELNMIVIPLVAFDKEGNRLGYGGGNYDRYLTQLDQACRQVGVAFSEQEVPFVPTEEHDIPIHVLAR